MVLLGLVICIAGFLAALLPPMAEGGTTYWAILLTLSILYPLVLSGTFRRNRADYEFRALHWFPAGIFILWFILELIGPRVELIHIFTLGFFFLWSLPLVALGIAFIIIFAVHVLRRSRLRTTILSILLALFTIGALYAEGTRANYRLQATVFPKNVAAFAVVSDAFDHLRASLGFRSGSSGILVAVSDSSSASSTPSSSFSPSSVRSSSRITFSSSANASATLPPVIAQRKPGHLTQSGPEAVALLGATLLAGYFGLLHARARKRV